MHERHGQQVAIAGLTQRAGLILIILGILLLAALLVWRGLLLP